MVKVADVTARDSRELAMVTTCKDEDGNCTVEQGPDGLPAQCIGAHSLAKHDVLRRYLQASSGARARFIPPPSWRAGAAYIDLFAGPGLARVRDTGAFVSGSPLLALQHETTPYSHYVFCDLSAQNVRALGRRVEPYRKPGRRISVLHGDANSLVTEIVQDAQFPSHGLNFALIDPFKLDALRFETIAQLASLDRMDLIINFPVGEIRRNASLVGDMITRAIGTSIWVGKVALPQDAPRLMVYLQQELVARFGYDPKLVKSQPVCTITNVPVYHLTFASKNALGTSIWDSIMQTEPGGQKRLKF